LVKCGSTANNLNPGDPEGQPMTPYELKSLNLPKLSGLALSIFVRLLASRFGQMLLLKSLEDSGGVTKLRSLHVDNPPTFYPLKISSDPSPIPEKAVDSPVENGNIPFSTARDFTLGYQEGTFTPLEVAEQVIENISRSEAGEVPLRLFIAQDREDFFTQAKSATQRAQKGQRLSPLDGVPVAIKDEVDMLPYPTTVGTAFLGTQPAQEDSTVVARLRAAGALLVGKTNMHEIGIGPNSINPHHGTVRNPYDVQRDAGGSSSGSAAAVAAGIVPAAIGADGGGSIRIPAAMCGVVGLKSTFGRISEYGAAPLDWSIAHLGPIAASVYDTALVYSIIAGPDPKDRYTLLQPPVTLSNWNTPHLEGMRCGVYPAWNEHADPEIVTCFKGMQSALEQRGATLCEIEIPELDEIRISHAITILSEMAKCMRPYKKQRRRMAESVQLSLILGESFSADDYLRAQQFRTRAMATFEKLFTEVDVILSPATAKTAQPLPSDNDSKDWSDLATSTEYMRYVNPANLTGLPAISFPIGYDSRGLPIGMQAMGDHWQEHLLLRVAYNAEQVLERKTPDHYFPVLNQ
jgi:Asp-tRNA(Asn)/Glu-tRNA(Gln) amidotransferase A subunit family amidase